jgi:hypothetical protein
MIQERDDDSAYFVRILIDSDFLGYLGDESLNDISFSNFSKLEDMTRNENFLNIIMYEVDLKFGDKGILLDQEKLDGAEKLFKQSIGSNSALLPGLAKGSLDPAMRLSTTEVFDKHGNEVKHSYEATGTESKVLHKPPPNPIKSADLSGISLDKL